MCGIKHTRNSKDKWGYVEICKPYIKDIEKRFKKNKSYTFRNCETLSDKQIENQHRSHLWRVFWYSFQQYKKGRKRKQYLRKIFKYWYSCPNTWGEKNNDFFQYDMICYWNMYAKSENKHIVFPKIRDILWHNQNALTKEQFRVLNWDIISVKFPNWSDEVINKKINIY